MTLRRTIATSAVTAALVLTGAASAFADDSDSSAHVPSVQQASGDQLHWHDGGTEGYICDFWNFSDPDVGGSGHDWSGWASPQLHVLHQMVVNDEGAVQVIYDRDIPHAWYHVADEENPEFVVTDPEGALRSDTAAQQTVILNGYRGSDDPADRNADALALLDRAGAEATLPDWLDDSRQSWMSDEYYESFLAEIAIFKKTYSERTVYTATQFAVWYFSNGRDVLGMFLETDQSGQVVLSDRANNLVSGVSEEAPKVNSETGEWDQNFYGNRRATLEVAAWLINQSNEHTAVMPQPGFEADETIVGADGSVDYGFIATLTDGIGDLHVELRMVDGTPVPSGVVLVDGTGLPVTSMTPGEKVYIRVPASVDVAALSQLQLWGSAQGSTTGTPRFYTGESHPSTHDPNNAVLDRPGTVAQHWLIGLDMTDQPTTAWGWIDTNLIAVPPLVPEIPETEQPGIDAPGVDAPPAVTPPTTGLIADPEKTAPSSAVNQPRQILALTGAEITGVAMIAGIIVLAGIGLILVRRYRGGRSDKI